MIVVAALSRLYTGDFELLEILRKAASASRKRAELIGCW